MIISFQQELLYSTPLEGGKWSIGVTKEQAKDIIELLQLAIEEPAVDMVWLRTKFYDEEGYMESDEAIRDFYGR